MSTLADVLEFAGVAERITRPTDEKFVTVRLNGGGAIQRAIGSGKTPVAFTGYRIRAGQFIYSRIDARNGAFAVVPAELSGAVVSKDFPVFEIRDDRVDARYLSHFFSSGQLEREIRARSRGATNRQRIKEDEFLGFPISLPSLREQCRIAAILDHADALRAKRRQILAHLDALSQSIFHDMFGNSTATVPLSDLVEGFRYGTSNKSGRGGQPTLRIPNVIGGGITTTEIKTVEVGAAELGRLTLCDGDLLFVRTNGNPDNVGRSAIFSKAAVESAGFGDQPWIYASYLIRARLTSEALPDFVAAYLATPQGRRQLRERSKTSAGQYNINVETLSSVMLPSAPVAEQHHFASRAEAVKVNQERIRKASRADDVLFASLQSRAFRGEL